MSVAQANERRALWHLRLLAAGAGLAVAANYIAQPALVDIARALHVSVGRVGLLVTFDQIGYGVGLLLMLPLADIVERRGLIMQLLVALGVVCIVAALVPSFTLLALASALMGLFACVAQVCVALAPNLLSPRRQSEALGYVFAGLLSGILGARVLAGFMATLWGWRSPFWVLGVAELAIAIALRLDLPKLHSTTGLTFRGAYRSMLELLAGNFELWRGIVTLAMLGIVFGDFWTTLTYRLAAPPFNFRPDIIGFFGVFGIAGVFSTRLVGKLADRQGPQRMVRLALAVEIVGIVLAAGFTNWLVLLIVGILIYDGAHQSAQVTNNSAVFYLNPEARNRLNAMLITSLFLGMGVGSFVGSELWVKWGNFGSFLPEILALLVALAWQLWHRNAALA